MGNDTLVFFGIALLAASVDDTVTPPPIAVTESKFQTDAIEQAIAVSRTVGGIISYTRWPVNPQQLRLCISGVTQVALRAAEIGHGASRPVALRKIAAGSATNDCDILYLGTMAPERQRQMISSVHGRPVLSIAESDPQCRGGTMFCLRVRTNALSFQLNIDAISRGTVRVDPRVLRITSANEGPA